MTPLLRYAAVGACATALHYGVLVLVVELARLPAWLGSGVGAACGAQLAYAGNRWFTFDHRGDIGSSWVRFQLIAALGAVAGMAIVGGAVALGLHYLPAQVIATVLAMLLTYQLNRVWSFR